jgi:hypothetical protein
MLNVRLRLGEHQPWDEMPYYPSPGSLWLDHLGPVFRRVRHSDFGRFRLLEHKEWLVHGTVSTPELLGRLCLEFSKLQGWLMHMPTPANQDAMEVQLTAISPVAYMVAKEGDMAVVKRNPPKKNEFRDKIGPATEAMLVFKGVTKIGMIPHEFIKHIGIASLKRVCQISKMDESRDVILVKLAQKNPTSS